MPIGLCLRTLATPNHDASLENVLTSLKKNSWLLRSANVRSSWKSWYVLVNGERGIRFVQSTWGDVKGCLKTIHIHSTVRNVHYILDYDHTLEIAQNQIRQSRIYCNLKNWKGLFPFDVLFGFFSGFQESCTYHTDASMSSLHVIVTIHQSSD